jgi:RHO1 GDP-GTP exchange protein 1/2
MCSITFAYIFCSAIGFYISKHGTPSRNSGCIKWETTAVACTHRGGHVLLFSPRFIEIRQVTTGRLVQVIEGQDIRLLYSGPKADCEETVLAAMRGEKNDQLGITEKIVELKETKEIGAGSATPTSSIPASVWEEWDM